MVNKPTLFNPSDTTDIGRSLACDGRFLYTTSSHGKGLAKFGSGLGGTLR